MWVKNGDVQLKVFCTLSFANDTHEADYLLIIVKFQLCV